MDAASPSNQGDSPREGGLYPSRRATWFWIAGAALLLLLGAAALVLYGRGGGPVPSYLGFLTQDTSGPLAPSSAAETFLRTVRLSGIERAVVGEADGKAVGRLEVSDVTSAADIDIAWQTAIGSLAAAYPSENLYVVQLFGPGAVPLAEVSAPGAVARDAIGRGDVSALRASATITYLAGGGGSR